MRYFFKIQYNGTNYHGWQYQPNAISIQETIQNQLYKLFKNRQSIIGCGRTDTGVHASQYYFHFDIEETIDLKTIQHKLNGMLPKDIYIQKIIPVEDKAHARFAATKRAYTYIISTIKNPFLIKRAWIYPYYPLNTTLMQQAAKDFMQYNDFPMLCKTGSDVNNYICTIFKSELTIDETKHQIIYNIEANRFLRNMIRRLTGLLVQIGRGQLDLKTFNETLRSKNQFKYITLAPPEGLYLSKVEYEFLNSTNT